MENQIKKFLEFEGKAIYFLAVNGTYWIAIKPICEALNVNYNRQFQNLKSHKVFSQLFAKQQITGSDGKLYQMVCLPERYVYGWLFSIRSESEDLATYQKKCCDILYEYFHGSITQRENLLREKSQTRLEIEKLERELYGSEEYKKISDLRKKENKTIGALQKFDKDLISAQLPIWRQQIFGEE